MVSKINYFKIINIIIIDWHFPLNVRQDFQLYQPVENRTKIKKVMKSLTKQKKVERFITFLIIIKG